MHLYVARTSDDVGDQASAQREPAERTPEPHGAWAPPAFSLERSGTQMLNIKDYSNSAVWGACHECEDKASEVQTQLPEFVSESRMKPCARHVR